MFRTAARGLFAGAVSATSATGRALLTCAAVIGLLSCGGGGDSTGNGTKRAEGVYTGFAPQVPTLSQEQALNWSVEPSAGSEGGDVGTGDSGAGSDGGVGAGGDGDGGVGAGGDFGQFRNALLVVKYPDGTPVGNGQALTDAATGMVTIVPRAGYQGPLLLELRGGNGATYYEEGKDAFLDFPAGQVIRAIVPRIDKNIGITPFSEAAYRLLTEGSTAERAANAAQPTAAEISAANAKVLAILNQQFPAALRVDDITRLPYIKSSSITANSIPIDARGRYGLVNGAFSKQAAMYNAGRTQPTLDAVAQLGTDLLDGVLDGMNGNQSAAAAAARTYDPNTLTGELTSALAEQSYRFGTEESKLALPRVTNFGNARYEGYLFDATLKPAGAAVTTVSGWVGPTDDGFAKPVGASSEPKIADRVFSLFGNLGHGGAFLKSNARDSLGKLYGFGDNVSGELGNGEIGLGSRAAKGSAVEIKLPNAASVTHVAGGFAHTLARLADGSVYSWGDNSFGQLGTGSAVASITPVRVSLPRGALAVAATNIASYALLDDGSVYAWGSSGGFGLLGDGNKHSASSVPVPVTALSQVVQITARDNDAAVLRKDGSVWHWGSFPADVKGFTDGDLVTPYAGGSPLPTKVVGLPTGVAIRKILPEQGLFAVLLVDGTVYEWGVYFDITANEILRDTEARRVLNLPPIRDMMPGGFIGYGVRPFDRLTAMGVDYRGGLWKIRGRVAEQYDPDNPTQQRRPQGQAPRSDCVGCHTFLNDWPLTPAAPTTNTICQPPATPHGSGTSSLIHAETECQMCHNPARTPALAAFPNGWLTCVKPLTLSPRAPAVNTTADGANKLQACTPSAAHVFTPPGTVCASCHNSVIARPLSAPTLNCAQPQSTALPTIRTTGSITVIGNGGTDVNAPIPRGGTTAITNPVLSGSLSAALVSGQSLRVLRNGVAVGSAAVAGAGWSYTDRGAGNGVPNGLQVYTVRVEAGTAFGPTSNSYAITIDTVAPTQTASVTQISDDFSGNLANAASTGDTTPTIAGTLSAVRGAGESLQLLRNGAVVATLTPAGTAWSYTEPAALTQAVYAYAARVIDAAGNVSTAAGSTRTVTVNTTFQLANAATTLVTINGVAPTAGAVPSNADNTPTLAGTLQRTLGTATAEVVRIYQAGSAVGTAAVTGTGWSFTTGPLADGSYVFSARIEQAGNAAVFGAPSSSITDPVDTTAPTQLVTITATSDVAPSTTITGAVAVPQSNAIVTQTNDPTPTVTVQLSSALSGTESLQIRRNGVLISPTTASCGTGCVRFTDNPGVAISVPATAPSALPVANAYTARVTDSAGNLGAQGSLTANFDYFACNQIRANVAYGGSPNPVSPHPTISDAATRCSDCHANVSPTDPVSGGTPSGRLVGVPSSVPAYWCRRP